MNTGRFTQQNRGGFHHGGQHGGRRGGSTSWRGQASPAFRSPPPGVMGSPWEYSPSPRGNRGGSRPSPNQRFRGQSSGGYNQRNSPYGSPYSSQSPFSSPNHPNFSPRGYHTSSPRYGSPGQHGRGRGNTGHRGWNQNKGRGRNRGSWNGGGDISAYFSPDMLADPWQELERLHISSKASDKDNQT